LKYLTLETVSAIQERSLEEYGGDRGLHR